MSKLSLKTYTVSKSNKFKFVFMSFLGIFGSFGYRERKVGDNLIVCADPEYGKKLYISQRKILKVKPDFNPSFRDSVAYTYTGKRYSIGVSYKNAEGETQSFGGSGYGGDEEFIERGFLTYFGNRDNDKEIIYSDPAKTDSHLDFVLRCNDEIVISSDSSNKPSGNIATTEGASYTATNEEGEEVRLSVAKFFSKTGTDVFKEGDQIKIEMRGSGTTNLRKGLYLFSYTSDDLASELSLPEGSTDIRIHVYLDVANLDGYEKSIPPKSDYFLDEVFLGEWVSYVGDFVVSGEGQPVCEYKIPGLVEDWLPISSSTSMEPVTDSGLTPNRRVVFRVRLDKPEQKFFGLSFNVRQGMDFETVEKQPVRLSGWGNSSNESWRVSSKDTRGWCSGRVVPRHSDMSVGCGGVVAYDTEDGYRSVNLRRHGEMIVFPDDSTYEVYWNSVPDGPPITYVSQSEVDGVVLGKWYGTEVDAEHRNVVAPYFRVLVGNLDVTPHITDFTTGSVTLAGPSNVFESIPNNVNEVRIENMQGPIYTGKAIRTDTVPYANGRQVTFQLISNTEYYDVDLSRVNLETETLPTSEADYVQRTMSASGYRGKIKTASGVDWRNTDFWQEPIPVGPGMELSEIESRYQNTQNTSTMSTIRMVLQANMLEVYDLPDGNLLIDTIIPKPELSALDLLKSADSIYCSSGGLFVNDPRINISEVSLALDDGFTETEVEGFSNEVNIGIGKGYANFVQNGKQNTFLTRESPGYTSNISWPDNPFQIIDNGALKYEFYPIEWFSEAQVSPTSASIEVQRIKQSWGFMGGGSKNIYRKEFVIMSGSEVARKFPERKDDLQEFLDAFMPALDDAENPKYDTPSKRLNNSRLVIGVSLAARGDRVSAATFHVKARVGKPQEANISVVPLEGRFDPRWSPEWFPPEVAEKTLQEYRDLKPRNARKISNPMIARIGSRYAVQVPDYPDGRIKLEDYDNDWTTSANQLATWLTIKDILSTRQVSISIAGGVSIMPNQFIFIARRPIGGPGNPVQQIDMLLTTSPGQVDARVGSEAWTRVRCCYVCTITDNEVDYDMPIGWGTVWQTPSYVDYEGVR